jgi:3-deoxy-D-manno-octulosonic acid kinase
LRTRAEKMTKDGVQRIAISGGAMLADPAGLGNLAASSLFEPAFWAGRGELVAVTRGRGSAWFVGPAHHWVLRHYRRGGFMSSFSRDRYVWAGEARVRAFAEWRLLATLVDRGVPVPKPIAARYVRRGIFYRCDLITQRIAGAEPLSARLAGEGMEARLWRNVGAVIARLHAAGADHADLNAHNILIDGAGGVSLIDFDRGTVRRPGSWAARNLSRLHRSLVKISRDMPADRFSAASWEALLAGYASG